MSAPGLRLFSICDRHHDRPGASRHGRGNRAPWAPAHRTEEVPDVSRAVPQRKRDGARDRIEKRTVHSLCPKKQERPMSLSNLSLNIYSFVYRVLMSNVLFRHLFTNSANIRFRDLRLIVSPW